MAGMGWIACKKPQIKPVSNTESLKPYISAYYREKRRYWVISFHENTQYQYSANATPHLAPGTGVQNTIWKCEP